MITKNSIKLFRQAAKNVDAYASFLKDRGIRADKIKTVEDWQQVPITDKNNYLRQYPLESLLQKDGHNGLLEFCSTSGSTGEPFYFPRSEELGVQYSKLIEGYLLQSDPKRNKNTLVLIGFGMGVWIGGVFTLRAFEIASKSLRYPLSILPVGYNKKEMFKALKQLAPQFDQTIIVGYPPFVKQLVDEAPEEGIDLLQLRTRYLFAAESFTEGFRDYICAKTNANPLLDTLNIYGTADIGAMAYESPVSILVRRLATADKQLFESIFGQIQKTPTLAQYNPDFIEFEEVDGTVVLTGRSVLPLIRYSIGDNGGVFAYKKMESILRERGYDLSAEIKKAGIPSIVPKQPFVYVYERSNFSATLHGINIYPEFIKDGLLNPELHAHVTGRFVMSTHYDAAQNQYLEIHVELSRGGKSSDVVKATVTKAIYESLIKKSSEFAEISRMPSKGDLVRVELWPQDYPKYFEPGIKQRWVQKNE